MPHRTHRARPLPTRPLHRAIDVAGLVPRWAREALCRRLGHRWADWEVVTRSRRTRGCLRCGHLEHRPQAPLADGPPPP